MVIILFGVFVHNDVLKDPAEIVGHLFVGVGVDGDELSEQGDGYEDHRGLLVE